MAGKCFFREDVFSEWCALSSPVLPRHRALILLFLLLNKGIRAQEEELSGATKGAENDQKHHNKNAPFVPVDGI